MNTVVQRLLKLSEFRSAGDISLEAGHYKEAIDAYLSGNMITLAKNVAIKYPEFKPYLDQKSVEIRPTNKASEGTSRENMISSLDWEGCLSSAHTEVLFEVYLCINNHETDELT